MMHPLLELLVMIFMALATANPALRGRLLTNQTANETAQALLATTAAAVEMLNQDLTNSSNVTNLNGTNLTVYGQNGAVTPTNMSGALVNTTHDLPILGTEKDSSKAVWPWLVAGFCAIGLIQGCCRDCKGGSGGGPHGGSGGSSARRSERDSDLAERAARRRRERAEEAAATARREAAAARREAAAANVHSTSSTSSSIENPITADAMTVHKNPQDVGDV